MKDTPFIPNTTATFVETDINVRGQFISILARYLIYRNVIFGNIIFIFFQKIFNILLYVFILRNDETSKTYS